MFLKWLHVVSMSVWVGGLITMGGLVAALRRNGAARETLQTLARGFGRVSWAAMAVAVLTGSWMAIDFIDQPLLAWKLGLVVAVAALAAFHQIASRSQSPAARGAVQAVILVLSLAAVWVGMQL